MDDPRIHFDHLLSALIAECGQATTSIDVICPYVKQAALSDCLLAYTGAAAIRLVMRWSEEDFLAGQSDPGVFAYCRDRGLALRHHPRVHMKLWVFDQVRVVATSANISRRALLDGPQTNREFALLFEDKQASQAAFEQIWSESEPVEAVPELPGPDDVKDPEEAVSTIRPFSLADLPTADSPEKLWHHYRGGDGSHPDLQYYSVQPGLDQGGFYRILRACFLGNPFVLALIDRLRRGSLYFGELKQWVADTCLDQPRPDARFLTASVSAALNWLYALGQGRFILERPQYSERLRYESSLGSHDGVVLTFSEERPTRPHGVSS